MVEGGVISCSGLGAGELGAGIRAPQVMQNTGWAVGWQGIVAAAAQDQGHEKHTAVHTDTLVLPHVSVQRLTLAAARHVSKCHMHAHINGMPYCPVLYCLCCRC